MSDVIIRPQNTAAASIFSNLVGLVPGGAEAYYHLNPA